MKKQYTYESRKCKLPQFDESRKGEKNYILERLSKAPFDVELASDELKSDVEFIISGVRINIDILSYLPNEIQTNRKIILEASKSDGLITSYDFFEGFRDDREICLIALLTYGEGISYISEKLCADEEIIRTAFKTFPDILEFCGPTMGNKKEFVLEVVSKAGCQLEHASKELQDDKEIVLEAVKNNGYALYFASDRLKNDRDIVLEAVNTYGFILENFGGKFRNDKEIMLRACKNNGCCLRYVGKELEKNREIVLAAVTNLGDSLRYANEIFLSDREIVKTALESNGSCFTLTYASEDLQLDRELVLIAVSKDPIFIKHMDVKFRSDEEILLAGVNYVSNNSDFWSYVDENLAWDREFVIRLLSRNGMALQDLGNDEFYEDKELCMVAVNQNPDALEFCEHFAESEKSEIIDEEVEGEGE